MTNPLIPGITAAEQDVLYQKLNEYNLKKASFKEVGAYLVVLPRADCPRYSLWIYSPLPERQSIFYIFDLSEDIHEALRMASTLCYYSPRPLSLVEYNAKRMQNKGDDIISFGKYHGHYLHEILRIDPGYLTWIAFKFTPRIPKQERFAHIARIYHSVYIDILHRRRWARRGVEPRRERAATESQATACRTLSWERRGKSDRPDPDRSQCPAGGRPLQDTSQRYDPLLLCPANTKAERHLRKSCDFPRQLPHGKQAFVPTTRRGTCLPDRRNRPYSLGTHCRYVHHRKKQMDAT